MRKILILMCGVVMMSSAVFADDTTTPETCANGAGTVVVGAVTGHKYCKSNTQMNWWNAQSWCDALNRRTFDISDCACSNTTADCHNRICIELVGVGNDQYIWTMKSNWEWSYNINLSSGTIRDWYDYSRKGAHYPALCY